MNKTGKLTTTSKFIHVAGNDDISLTVLGLPQSIQSSIKQYDLRTASIQQSTTPISKPICFGPDTPLSIVENYKRSLTMEQDLNANVDSKSLILSRLMHEANEQAEELARLSEELVSLRDENKTLNQNVAVLNQALSEQTVVLTNRSESLKMRQKEAAKAAKNANSINEQHHLQLEGVGAGILELQLKRKQMFAKVDEFKRILLKYPLLPSKSNWAEKMEKAIRIQMLYVERMKKENVQMNAFKERMERNERVIQMMEKKLYSSTGFGGHDSASMHPRVKYRIRDLQEQVMQASDRNQALHIVLNNDMNANTISELMHTAKNDTEGRDSDTNIEKFQRRVETLQKQMIDNARSFAQDLSRAKLNLMQAQIGRESDSDDSDD